MKSNVYIPDNIEVGFRHVDDANNGKLAYVTYRDDKGVLRKEKSWRLWIDKSIDTLTIKNEPTEGFTLKHKVGGNKYGWNYRNMYVRVYDPRGVEFEITVENLLYILEYAGIRQGKQMEGKYIYGWAGADMTLMPISAPDYQTSQDISSRIDRKEYILGSQLKVGETYIMKSGEKALYLGRSMEYKLVHNSRAANQTYYIESGNSYWFCMKSTKGKHTIISIKSLGNRIVKKSIDKYDLGLEDAIRLLNAERKYNPPVDLEKSEYTPVTLEKLKEQGSGIFFIGEKKKRAVDFRVNAYKYQKMYMLEIWDIKKGAGTSRFTTESEINEYIEREKANFLTQYKK